MEKFNSYINAVDNFLCKLKMPLLTFEQETYIRVYLEKCYDAIKVVGSEIFVDETCGGVSYRLSVGKFMALSAAIATCMVHPSLLYPTKERIYAGIHKLNECKIYFAGKELEF